MKKTLIISIFFYITQLFSQDSINYPYRWNEVESIQDLRDSPVGCYCIISKKEFNTAIQNGGSEKNKGQYNHTASLFNETEYQYFVSSPEDRNNEPILFYFYKGNNDKGPHIIYVRRSKVLIVKKGEMEVPNYKE